MRKILITVLLVWCALGWGAGAAWGAWIDASPMNAMRRDHSSVVLPNGKLLVIGGGSANGSATTAEIFDPDKGTWQPAGSLNASRVLHTATLLHDGRVLVAGGTTSGNSAELYDPATGVWTPTGSMMFDRSRHTATLLANGKVLVTGGRSQVTGASRAEAELFDPGTGRWSSTGSMPYVCEFHAAVMMRTGQVLVTGGQYQLSGSPAPFTIATSATYDPGTGQWTSAGALPTPRIGHAAVMLMNTGQVLVTGGFNNIVTLSDAALFEPSTRSWTPTGSLAVGRGFHTATRLADDRVLVVGGSDYSVYPAAVRNSAEIYDTTSGQWSPAGTVAARTNHISNLLPDGTVIVAGGITAFPTPVTETILASAQRYRVSQGAWSSLATTLPTTRSQPTATLLSSGKVLITGGGSWNGPTMTPQTSTAMYDPSSTLAWTTGPSLLSARSEHSATLLADGRVLVVGGYVAGAELYDPAANIWRATGRPTVTRGRHGATLLADGRVLLSGGENPFGSNPSRAEIFDPAAGNWTDGGDMLGPRYAHSATLLPDGRVLVAGGSTGAGGSLASALLYDPATNTWAATGTMNVARMFHTATLLPGGKVLVAGGLNNNIRLNSTELFDPSTGLWTPTGNLSIARSSHQAVLLPTGQVMLNGDDSSVDLYDPLSGQWSLTAGLSALRYNHASLLLPDNRVMVVGGLTTNGAPQNALELYDTNLYYMHASSRAYVDTVTNPLYPGRAITLGGYSYGFTAYSGPSSGNGSDSSSSQPIVQLRRLDNDAIAYATPAALGNSTYASAAIGTLPVGAYRLTMFVNASPSFARIFSVLPLSKPGTPTLDRMIPGSGMLKIYFTPSAADGGLASTGFTVTCTPTTGSGTPIVVQGFNSPITVSGLTNGLAYSCQIAAANSLGTSSASASLAQRVGSNLTPILSILLFD